MDAFELKYRFLLESIINEAPNNEDLGDAPDPSTFGSNDDAASPESENNQSQEQQPEPSLEERTPSDPLKLYMAKLAFQIFKMDPEDSKLKNFRLSDYASLNKILKNNPDNRALFNLTSTLIRKLKPFGDGAHNSIPELRKLNDRDGSKNNILKTWLDYIFSFIQYNKVGNLGFAKGEQMKAFDSVTGDNLDNFEATVRDITS